MVDYYNHMKMNSFTIIIIQHLVTMVTMEKWELSKNNSTLRKKKIAIQNLPLCNEKCMNFE